MGEAIKFKDEGEKKQAIINSLTKLSGHVGWQVCKKAVRSAVKEIDEKLRGNMEWDKDDSIERLQAQRRDRISLLELPESIIKDLEEVESTPPEFDPYE